MNHFRNHLRYSYSIMQMALNIIFRTSKHRFLWLRLASSVTRFQIKSICNHSQMLQIDFGVFGHLVRVCLPRKIHFGASASHFQIQILLVRWFLLVECSTFNVRAIAKKGKTLVLPTICKVFEFPMNPHEEEKKQHSYTQQE